jgi:MscS family membrane protein
MFDRDCLQRLVATAIVAISTLFVAAQDAPVGVGPKTPVAATKPGADDTAQLPTSAAPPPSKAEPKATIDPLGRETPRGTMMGLLKYGERQDFATAARYFQLDPDQGTDFVQLAKELQALRLRFKSNIGLLSDDPNGSVEAGLPLGQVRAGVFAVGATTTDVILVRVDDPTSGKIWLISKETVATIPQLYAQMESEGPTAADRIATVALSGRQLLGCPSGNGSGGYCLFRSLGCWLGCWGLY